MGLSLQWWPTRPSFDAYAARDKSSGVLVSSYCCSTYRVADPFSSLDTFSNSSIGGPVIHPIADCEHMGWIHRWGSLWMVHPCGSSWVVSLTASWVLTNRGTWVRIVKIPRGNKKGLSPGLCPGWGGNLGGMIADQSPIRMGLCSLRSR